MIVSIDLLILIFRTLLFYVFIWDVISTFYHIVTKLCWPINQKYMIILSMQNQIHLDLQSLTILFQGR